MNDSIKRLFNNLHSINDLAVNIIKLSDFVVKQKPNVCLVPLRGAIPIRILISYVIKLKKQPLPDFRFIHLTSSEGINKRFLDSLHSLSKIPQRVKDNEFKISKGLFKSYNKVLLLDEVGTGNCWLILLSPFLEDLFNYLNKELKTKELIATGLALNNSTNNRKERFKFFLEKPFKLIYGFDYEPVTKLFNIIKINCLKNNELLPKMGLFGLFKITNNIKSVNDYKSQVIDLIIYLIINSIITGADNKQLNNHGFKLSDSDFNYFYNSIERLVKQSNNNLIIKINNTYLKNMRSIISNLIKNNLNFFKAKLKNGELDFNVKKTSNKLLIKTFNVKSIPFADDPVLIGVDRDYILNNKVTYYEINNQEPSKQFYLLMKLLIDKQLNNFNKKEWFNLLSTINDEEFKKELNKIL